jgi:hypothetical protein
LQGAFATRQEAEAWMRQLNEAGVDYINLQELEGRYQASAALPNPSRWESRAFDRREDAEAAVARWKNEGATYSNVFDHGGQFRVYAVLRGEFIHAERGRTMPRDKTFTHGNPGTGKPLQFSDLETRLGLRTWPHDLSALPPRLRSWLEGLRLFTVHTRNYLRRRTWRYFRRLGKQQPERYVPALVEALKLYTDDDTADGLALLDNWGLVHVLFHLCPALLARASGWTLGADHSLAELSPAPIYESLWLATPRALLDLLRNARCRPVRQWAVHLIRRDPAAVLRHLPLSEVLDLLLHPDEDVVTLAGETLQRTPGLDMVPLERWFALLETPNPTALDIICDLMARHVRPEQVSSADRVRLASSRPVPVARLGLRWLRTRPPQNEEDCRALLGLAEAQAEPVRGEIVHWARQVLSAAAYFRPEWVLEFLDSRHEDVRAEGWAWLQEEPRAREQVELWRRLLESPYDDVRLKLVADLERRVTRDSKALSERVALDPVLVRFLWAAVLLNIDRGNRHKLPVVGQIVRRLEQWPDEAKELLPLLAVALRSLRGPEWRAGLAGVVQIVGRRPELEADVHALFPELRI